MASPGDNSFLVRDSLYVGHPLKTTNVARVSSCGLYVVTLMGGQPYDPLIRTVPMHWADNAVTGKYCSVGPLF